MRSALLFFLGLFTTNVLFAIDADNDAKLIELSKVYKGFMFRNDPPKSYLKSF